MSKISNLARLRHLIALHRDNPLFRAAATIAEKYLRAYNNEVSWSVWENGERYTLETILPRISGCLIDVGANCGQWASMAHMVDPGRPIHSFEISPTTFALLLENLRGIQPCIVNQLGLSDTEAEVELHYYPDSSERSSLIELPDGFRKEIQKVHVTTGDAYLRTANVAQVAFLKIDVEGHEMAVLKGFSEAIQEGRVSAVQFEHGPAHVATRHFLGDFVEFFACRGYNLYKIFPRKLEPLIYSFENSERYTGSNYVAVRSNVVF